MAFSSYSVEATRTPAGTPNNLVVATDVAGGFSGFLYVAGSLAPTVTSSTLQVLPSSASSAGFQLFNPSAVKSNYSVAWDMTQPAAIASFNADANSLDADPNLAALPLPTSCVSTPDIDGDGALDLFRVDAVGNAEVVLGEGDGSFGARPHFHARTNSANALAVADVDGDGQADVIALTPTPGIRVLFGSGHQIGYGIDETLLPTAATAMTSGDFFGTGTVDLALTDIFGNLSLVPGSTSGVFGVPQPLSVSSPPSDLPPVTAADFGGPAPGVDLFTVSSAGFFANYVTAYALWRQTASTATLVQTTLSPTSPFKFDSGCATITADTNGDQIDDLVTVCVSNTLGKMAAFGATASTVGNTLSFSAWTTLYPPTGTQTFPLPPLALGRTVHARSSSCPTSLPGATAALPPSHRLVRLLARSPLCQRAAPSDASTTIPSPTWSSLMARATCMF